MRPNFTAGKLIQQLNGQTQRLLGQQSLAAYTGLQVGDSAYSNCITAAVFAALCAGSKHVASACAADNTRPHLELVHSG